MSLLKTRKQAAVAAALMSRSENSVHAMASRPHSRNFFNIKCINFDSGFCGYGDRCRFVHSSLDVDDYKYIRQDRKRIRNSYISISPYNQRCVNFNAGYCQTGEACRYVHVKDTDDEDDVSQHRPHQKSESILHSLSPFHQRCVNFNAGNCQTGDVCRYVHVKEVDDDDEDVVVHGPRPPTPPPAYNSSHHHHHDRFVMHPVVVEELPPPPYGA